MSTLLQQQHNADVENFHFWSDECGNSCLVVKVKMALVLDGTGYVAVAWPEVPGQMVGADAVIAWISDEGPNIGVYKMESKSASGVIESDVFEVSDAEISVEDGKTTLTFTR